MKTVAVIVSGGIVNIVNSTLTKLINSPIQFHLEKIRIPLKSNL